MRRAGRHPLAAAALLALAALASPARADRLPGQLPAVGQDGAGGKNEPIAKLNGVDVVERLGARLPLDATLRDETGAPIALGTLFGDGLPVIVTFNYSSCPMLCNVMLGGLTKTLTDLDWSVGKQFRIVTIGLDPKETHQKAMETKLGYLDRYGRATARPGDATNARPTAAELDDGWRFLTGDAATIARLADAVGFRYRQLPDTGEILHPAVLMVMSPGAEVVQYLYGVEFAPAELKTGLTAAALGKITPSSTKFLLACFHYEARAGFAATAMKIMRYGGFVFVLALALYLFRSIRSSRTLRERPLGSH